MWLSHTVTCTYLTQEVDVPLLWSNLLEACDMPAPGSQAGGGAKSRRPSTSEAAAAHQDTMMGLDGTPALNGSGKAGSEVLQQLRACTVGVMGRPKLRLTLLPPPADRSDPLAVVELGKAAEVSEWGGVSEGGFALPLSMRMHHNTVTTQ
jgi:hypothetical protein